MFAAGITTFALLYAPQALLPELAHRFAISPASSALSISVSTIGLGLALLVAGPLTELLGRTPLMFASLIGASVLGIAIAFVPNWPVLLALRLVQGIALAGLPAVATAYLREEVHHSVTARATGTYVGGTALGGMLGRLVTGAVSDLFDWRLALGAVGVIGLGCAVAVVALLPRSRNFVPAPASASQVLATARRVLTDPALLALYGISFTLMGGFVGTYNAMGFRLAAPPYQLSVGLASLVFLAYALGSVSSSWAGRLADRFGQRTVVPLAIVLMLAGMAITLMSPLPLVVLGICVLTTGFFAAHGVASGWVATRAALGGGGTGQAASLYLFAYYLGSSVIGTSTGLAWDRGHWPAVTLLVSTLFAIGLVLSLLLRRIPKLGRD